MNSSQEVAWCKLKPKLLFWDEVSTKGLRRNIFLIQTHWQLVWYFYFGLWVQSIILFSLAVKILTSIDWLDYSTKISAVCQLTQAAALSPKENYLKIHWQHWTVPSRFLIKEIRSFNSCFTLWYWVLLQFVYFPRNTANHVQLVINGRLQAILEIIQRVVKI